MTEPAGVPDEPWPCAECKRPAVCLSAPGQCVLNPPAGVPDVAADVREQVASDRRLDFPWNHKHGPTVREVLVAELDRLAVLAAAAEEAQPGRDREYRLNIEPKTAAAELCRANIELHAINAQVVRRAVAAEARAVAAEAERDTLRTEAKATQQTLAEVFAHLVSITAHKQRCDEPDDPGCPGCVVNSEWERVKAGEFADAAAAGRGEDA